MTAHTIEIEGLPEGWEAVAYRVPKIGESFMSNDGDLVTNNIGQSSSRLIVQKTKPRRIVLEEIEEGKHDICLLGEAGCNSYWKRIKEE